MESGSNLSGLILDYINNNISGLILDYIKNNQELIIQITNRNQELLELQKNNISFRYSQIQSLLGILALVGVILFVGSYGYIRYQAKKTINIIKDEKQELELKYNELLTQTTLDIELIKNDNQFQILLMKGLTLKSIKLFNEALDLYDNMLAEQFIQSNEDKKYSVYKEIADTHYMIGESSEMIYENNANYFNAINALEQAMEIYTKTEDEDLLVTLQDKYSELSEL